MDQIPQLKQIERHFKQVLLYAPGMAGNEAVNFFLDRFRERNWLNIRRSAWKDRKDPTKWGPAKRNKGRAILVLSGRLRRSIRITSIANLQVHIGSDAPYAKAHNEGFKGIVTQHVSPYTRKVNRTGIIKRTALKTRSKIKWGKVTVRETTVKGHTRKIKQNIPRRQFMGRSQQLDEKIKRLLIAELMKGIR
ncbi:hypothetical protein F0L74_05985 [Chitinophaga agrisoli]|uniref:Virion morphogenesis family protein n=1 Tax=Chitinophaga agrisoli TaxID=2607653 RepID=A0A5B2W4L8_9BACT|nr:phage virion morphogenesis protein [Chitinophaga agrisoli]KAA2245506.1 hypothetical protein F0L74_05985 [Chitinophaga agrisoli]